MKFASYNFTYLNRIIDFCKHHGKRVILIRSPLHEKYPGYSEENAYQEIRKRLYRSVEYLDFSRFPAKNSEFGDLLHLNYKGSRVFSIWFAGLINNGLLDKPDKQAYIDNEIQALRQKAGVAELVK